MKSGQSSPKIESRCCQSGCSDCPWGFESDPNIPGEFIQEKKKSSIKNGEKTLEELQELAEKYLQDLSPKP